MITYSKAEIESKKKYKNFKMLTTILKSVDTFVFATTSNSVTLSVTGIVLIVIPISTGTVYGLSCSNTVIFGIILQKCSKQIRHYQRAQQTMISFDKFHKRCLQYNITDKEEYESLSIFFTKTILKSKTIHFGKYKVRNLFFFK